MQARQGICDDEAMAPRCELELPCGNGNPSGIPDTLPAASDAVAIAMTGSHSRVCLMVAIRTRFFGMAGMGERWTPTSCFGTS
jgi:hypothetical protein